MPNESAMTRKLCTGLKLLGIIYHAVVGSAMQQDGWPDRFFSALGLPGGCAWVEFKKPGNNYSVKQRKRLRELHKRGVLAVGFWFDTNEFKDYQGNVIGKADASKPAEWFAELKRLGVDRAEWCPDQK